MKGFIPAKYYHYFLALFSFLLYIQTLSYGFVLDDAIVISENFLTQNGIAGIPEIFYHDSFYGFFQDEAKALLVAGGRYRPLSLALFAVEYELFSSEPWFHHLMNILWYSGLVVLLYFLIRNVLKLNKLKKYSSAAFLGSLLFAVHPVHSEVVANIKGRDEILVMFFGILALWFSLRLWQNKNRVISGVFLFLSLLLSLLSKENGIAFLFLIPLLFAVMKPNKKLYIKKLFISLLWAVGACILYAIIRFSVIEPAFFREAPKELLNNPFLKVVSGSYIPYNFEEWSATITYTLLEYLRLLFIPLPLTHDYYPAHITAFTWGDILPWLGLILYAMLVLGGIWGIKKRNLYSWGIWIYLIALFPVSNILLPVGTFMSERFLFVPSMGLAVIAAALAYKRKWISYFIMGLSLIFLVLTLIRTPAWKSNYSLFSTDIKTSVRSAKLNNALGGEITTMAGNAEDERRKKELAQKAIPYLKNAVQIHPAYKNAWLLLGNAHFYLQEYENALRYYNSALSIDPDYKDALSNKLIVLKKAGRYFGEEKQEFQKAKRLLLQAYELDAEDVETMRLIAVSSAFLGDSDEAIRWFKKALEADPESPRLLFDLGTAYYQKGNEEKGSFYHNRARSIDPQIN